MSETESKAMEVDKENIEPIKSTDEKIAKIAEDNDVEMDLTQFTEDRMFDDMLKCIDNKELGAANSKKAFRTALEKKYNLKKKALKRFEPFVVAIGRITTKLSENNPGGDSEQKEPENQEAAKEKELEEFQNAINPNKKKKKKKAEKESENEEEKNDDDGNDGNKKKRKKKKSRKRKLPSSDNDNDSDDNDMYDPPKKKRKKNCGASVNDEFAEKKAKTNRKKKKSAPGEWTLKKLKKLLKVTHLANPRVYSEMKGKSIKKQVKFVQNILQENGVDFSCLSDQRIKTIQKEYALKKEMEELGISEFNVDENKNGGRSKRKRNKVCYNDTVKSDKSGSESEEMAPMEVKEESSDEPYEPHSDDDSDEEYNDSDY